MKRRIISLLLVFCMVFSLVPTTAFAVTDKQEPPIELTNPFKDVKETDWFYDAVQYARMNGFFNGTSATTFDPGGTMTRGMFITVLGRMAGVDPENYKGQSAFTDVPSDAYYAPYVAWASKHGITEGTGNGKFSPDALINRAQMATFFVRYFEIFGVDYGTDANVTTTPADMDSVPSWAKEAALKLWKQGLLNGDGINFNPNDNASRAQAATLCMRADEAVDTWYKEPGVASDRVKIDPTTGEPVTPDDGDQPADDDDSAGSGFPGSDWVPGIPDDGTTTTTYYEVKFAMGNGQDTEGVTMPENKTYPANAKISLLPTPFKHNGLFLGWYYDSAMERAVGNDDVLTRNMTLYAKMGEITPVSEVETPNYITVVVPADEVADYTFGVKNYSAGSVEYFTHVSSLNTAVDYSLVGTEVQADYEQGQTYSFKLQDDSAAFLVVNGTEQPSSIRVLNIITEKSEVQNLALDGDVKLLPAASVTNMTGTALDGLFNISISGQSGEGSISQNKNVGTFTYAGGGIAEGDVVAIYEGTRPDQRDAATQNEAVAYVEITAIDGDTYNYKTADTEDVLFTPDVLPVTSTVAESAVMTLDGETEKYVITVYQDDMQFTDDVFAELGLDSQTTVDVGDFIAFYSGAFGANAESEGYGLIDEIAEGEDEGKETYIITYVEADIDDVLSAMDIYSTRNEEIEMTQEEIDRIEADMVQQAISSGFVEEAAEYLTALAIETDGFQELSDDLDMDLSSYSITFADGTPVDPETMDLMAVNAEITEQDIKAQLFVGDLVHFEDGKGIRAELVMTFTVEVGEKLEIILEAVFEQEVLLQINVSGGAVWKWKWIFPYIADYELNANFDVGTFTGIGITATAKTIGEEDEEVSFNWNESTGNKAGDKIVSIGKQIHDLIDKKNEFMDRYTIPTLGMGTESDGIDDELESAGSITSGGLAEKYADFMENVEESWLEIIRVNIFESEGHVDPLHILCYGISADFVVSANLYVTIGMTFEYGVAKRYNFSLSLFAKKATTDTIDLEESHYQFDFYVMGTIGIRAGIEFEVAVGLFSLKLDSIGICAEAGAYAQMWGYFYYSLAWSKSEGKSSYYAGAMCIEIGMYLSVSFKAQLFSSDKLTYNPTLYEEDWPLLTIGETENVYDFAYGDDDDILAMEVETAKEFAIPTELFNMNYLDMKSGELYGSDSDSEEDADDEPDNEPGNFDDEEESHYTITLSNPKFTYNPKYNMVTLDPGISIEETCEITISWQYGTLAFSTQPLERTLTIHWTDPANRRYISFNSMGGSTVKTISAATGTELQIPTPPSMVGYDFAGWYTDWNYITEFDFPSTMPNYLELSNGRYKGITVYAKWEPRTDIQYTVEHYLEEMGGRYKLAQELNIDYLASGYDLSQPSVEEFHNGVSDQPIVVRLSGDNTEYENTVVVTPRNYPGFTARPVTVRQNTAPDGTSVVEIYYSRNICTSTFTYGGCEEDTSDFTSDNAAVLIKAKYGSTIYAPSLYLQGYVFRGFGLTDAQLSDGVFVAGDTTYTATWALDNDTSYRIERYVERSDKSGSYLLATENAIITVPAWDARDALPVSALNDAKLNQIGLEFKEIRVNGEKITASDITIAADGSTVIKLYHDRTSHTLTFMDGDTAYETRENVKYGTRPAAPETNPTKTGYTFDGWYTQDGSETGEWGTKVTFSIYTMPAEPTILYAKWKAGTGTAYRVEHYLQNITGDTESDYTLCETENKTGITGEDTAAEGKTYEGFQPAKTFEQIAIAGDGSTVVQICYDRVICTVSFTHDGESEEIASQPIRYGGKATAPGDPTKTGYSFDCWKNAQGKVWNFDADTVTADTVLTAQWIADGDTAYRVEHYLENLDGTYPAEPEETENKTGTTGAAAAVTEKEYTGFGTGIYTDTTIAADGSTVVEVRHPRNSYTVTWYDWDGTTVLGSERFKYEQSITVPDTVTKPSRTGYTFGSWADAGTMPAENKAITASEATGSWTVNTYTVVFDANSGTGTMVDQPFTYGEEKALTANDFSKSGYQFAGWNTEANGSGTPYSDAQNVSNLTAENNGTVTLYAQWTKGAYIISYDLADGTLTEANPVSYDVETESFTLNNPTRTGYTFAGWTGTGLDSATVDVTVTKGSTGNRSYTATWTVNTYTVAFDANGGEGIMGSLSFTYGEEKALTSNVFTKSGYTFAGWTAEANGSGKSYSDAQKVSNLTAENNGTVTLYAQWTKGDYAISYDPAGGTLAEGNPVTYDVETESFTLNNPTRTGYTFAGWTGTGLDSATVDVTVTKGSIGNRSYTATWTANKYDVAFNLCYEGAPTASTLEQTYDANYTLPNAPSRAGYAFLGWFTDAQGGTLVDTTVKMITAAAHTLYAHWDFGTETPYKVRHWQQNVDDDQYTEVTADVQTLNGTTNGQTNAAAKTDYTGFTAKAFEQQTIAADGSTVVDIYYDRDVHKVIWVVDGVSTPEEYRYGATISKLDDPTKTGYTFIAWDKEIPATMPAGDMTITATWKTIYYNLNINLAEGEWKSGDSVPETYTIESDDIILPTPVRTGYTFTGWTGYNGDTPNTNVTIPKGSIDHRQYTANWSIGQYIVTLNANDGTLASELTEYTYGAGATLPNATRDGYTFGGWYDNAEFTGNAVTEISTTDSGDKVFYAKWDEIRHTVSFETFGGTEIAAQTVSNNGYAQQPSSDPKKTGYTFEGWCSGENLQFTFSFDRQTITRDTTVYAKWKPNTYTVDFNKNSGSGSLSDQYFTYDVAQELTKNKFTQTGFTFAGWNTKADGSGTAYTDGQSVINLTAEQSGTVILYAQWTPATYTVKFNSLFADVDNPEDRTVKYGEAYGKLPVLEKAGYIFNGWFTSQIDGTQVTAETIYDGSGAINYQVTLYARWTQIKYTVTFVTNGGTEIGPYTDKVYGSTVQAPYAPTKTGCTFAGWYADEECTEAFAFPATITDNITVYAKWSTQTQTYTVTLDMNNNGTNTQITVEHGGKYQDLYSPTSNDDYLVFSHWSTLKDDLDGDCRVENGGAISQNNHHTLYAQWVGKTMTFKYDLSDGTGLVEEQVVYYGSLRITLRSAPTRLGYTFQGWKSSLNGNTYGAGGEYSLPSSGETGAGEGDTFTAQWTPIKYQLTAKKIVPGDYGSTTIHTIDDYSIETGPYTLLEDTANQYETVTWYFDYECTTVAGKPGAVLTFDQLVCYADGSERIYLYAVAESKFATIDSLEELMELQQVYAGKIPGVDPHKLPATICLTTDIELPANWVAIGNSSNPFMKNFDGQGNTITLTSGSYQPLFHTIHTGTVENLIVEVAPDVTAETADNSNNWGIFAGTLDYGGKLKNCTVTGYGTLVDGQCHITVDAAIGNVGILVGYVTAWQNPTVEDCYVLNLSANLSPNYNNIGNAHVGGMVGRLCGTMSFTKAETYYLDAYIIAKPKVGGIYSGYSGLVAGLVDNSGLGEPSAAGTIQGVEGAEAIFHNQNADVNYGPSVAASIASDKSKPIKNIVVSTPNSTATYGSDGTMTRPYNE